MPVNNLGQPLFFIDHNDTTMYKELIETREALYRCRGLLESYKATLDSIELRDKTKITI